VLGLDLQGGISIVLFPVKGSDLSALNTATDIIRNRVDGLGIAEPDVQRQGDTIVVNMPGVKDRTKAENLVGDTAELRFRAVQYQGNNPMILPSKRGERRRRPVARPRPRVPAERPRAWGGATTTSARERVGYRTVDDEGQAAGPSERTISTLPIANRPGQQSPSTTSPNLTPTTMQTTTTTAPRRLRRAARR
jgi:preprotein translocase subunit SecD